jgi:hypothetical protein
LRSLPELLPLGGFPLATYTVLTLQQNHLAIKPGKSGAVEISMGQNLALIKVHFLIPPLILMSFPERDSRYPLCRFPGIILPLGELSGAIRTMLLGAIPDIWSFCSTHCVFANSRIS